MATEEELREQVALACQILAQHGLVKGSAGHVSCRVPGEDYILIRGRPPVDPGLRFAPVESIIRVDLDGKVIGNTNGVRRVSEVYIHTEIYKRRPDVNCVLHAHPPAVRLCTISDVPLKVISSQPADVRRIIEDGGIPVFGRTITLHNPEETAPMVDVMGDKNICLMRAHGLAAAGASIEAAVRLALSMESFARLSWLASLRGVPIPEVPPEDKETFLRRRGTEDQNELHPMGGEPVPSGDGEGEGWAYLKAMLDTGALQFNEMAGLGAP